MKSILRFFLISVCTAYLFTSCSDDPAPQPDEVADYTVLVYMAADNSLSGFATSDYAEIKKGMTEVTAEDVHLLVYMDTGSSPRLVELKRKNGQVTEEVVKSYESRNSVGVDETIEVFEDVFSNKAYKADRYGLVYWSHGDGWVPYPLTSSKADTRWIGQDTGSGDKRMNLSDFKTVLQSAPHLDFMLMDACFVSSIEVAYELRSFTDYYMGSPTETPGPGAPYDKIVPLMFSADNAATKMADAYFRVYADKYNGGVGISDTNWTGGVSICVMSTAAIEQLAVATRSALQSLSDASGNLRSQVFDYDKRSSTYIGYFDMYGLMQTVLTPAAFESWKSSFEAVRAYWDTTAMNYSSKGGMFSMNGAHGITHFIPSAASSAADAAYRSTSWYSAAGLSALGW